MNKDQQNKNRKVDSAEVLIFPPLLYILTLACGLVLSYFVSITVIPSKISILLGVVFFIAGILFTFAGSRSLVQNKTTVNPSGSTITIVKKGVYSITRNPMYVGFTLLYSGTSFLFSAWASFVLLVPLLVLVQKGIIEREETYLEKKFGTEYLSYKSATSRWL